jgi:hypothetical protein
MGKFTSCVLSNEHAFAQCGSPKSHIGWDHMRSDIILVKIMDISCSNYSPITIKSPISTSNVGLMKV